MVDSVQQQQRKAIIFLALISVIFLIPILYKDNISVYNPDVITQSSYFEYLLKRNLGGGLSFWNPHIYSGTPFLGNPLSSLFYPLNIINYFLPYFLSYKIIVLFSLFFSCLFMFLYLRFIKRSVFASLFGAISYGFSGMFVTWLFIPSFIGAVLWFPLVIFLIEIILTKQKYYFGVLLSAIFAVQILSGGTQIFFYCFFISVMYFVLRIFYVNVRRKQAFVIRQSKFLLIFVILGVLLSSFSLLPALEFGSLSIRSQGVTYEEASIHSIPIQGFINLIMPNFYGNPNRETYWAFWKKASFSELTIYLGLGALIFAALALFYFRDKYVKIFSLIALFCVLFALGSNFLLFRFFYNAVPGFDLFRVPARMMMFFIFSLSVISSVGLDAFLSKGLEKKQIYKFIKVNYVLIGLSFILLLFFVFYRENVLSFGEGLLKDIYYANLNTSRVGGQELSFFLSLVPSVYKEILFSILVFVFVYFVYILLMTLRLNNAIKLKKFKLFLIILLMFDLWIFSGLLVKAESYEKIYNDNALINFLEKNVNGERIVYLENPLTGSPGFPAGHLNIKSNIQRIDGCAGIAILDYSNFVCKINNCTTKRHECVIVDQILNENYLNMLNVRYIVSQKKLEDYTQAYFDGEIYVYKNNRALPRAYIVHNYLVVLDKEKILDVIGKKDFDPSYFVLFDENVSYDTVLEGFDTQEYARVNKYSPNKIEVEAKLNHPGFLVLSEINYVGWDAFVDGRRSEVLNANYLFRSVYLEKGEHRVIFEYNPASFKLGLYVTIVSLLVLVLLFVYLFMKSKKTKK